MAGMGLFKRELQNQTEHFWRSLCRVNEPSRVVLQFFDNLAILARG